MEDNAAVVTSSPVSANGSTQSANLVLMASEFHVSDETGTYIPDDSINKFQG